MYVRKFAIVGNTVPPLRTRHYKSYERIDISQRSALFKAWDEDLRKEVVAKIPFRPVPSIVREMNMSLHMNGCDNVPTCHGMFRGTFKKHRDVPYLLFDAVTGDDMEHHVFSERPLHETIYHMIDMALFVQQCHQKNTIHRDIKLNNFVLNNLDGKVYGIDMGGAVWKGDVHQRYKSIRSGTPVYMPPEMYCGGLYDASTDVWSLGVSFYRLMYRRFPFHNEVLDQPFSAEKEWSIASTFDRFDVSPRYDDEYPESLNDLVKDMIDFVPDSRPTITNVLQRLRLIASCA